MAEKIPDMAIRMSTKQHASKVIMHATPMHMHGAQPGPAISPIQYSVARGSMRWNLGFAAFRIQYVVQ